MKSMHLFKPLVLAIFALGLNAAEAQGGRMGYLAPGSFDILQVLPAAPVKGDARYKADRKIFKRTRKLAGSPRWMLATGDVRTSTPDLMRDFSCAAGTALSPDRAPKVAALVERASIDTRRGTNIAKDFYKRLRPYQIDRGAICQPAEELAGTFDYPSGHTTLGWTWATLLAELIPDRATQILARGRAYGESRIVCGVHNASAVEAGEISVAATLAVVHASPAFQADLAAARAEVEALRREAAAPAPECSAEEKLVAERAF